MTQQQPHFTVTIDITKTGTELEASLQRLRWSFGDNNISSTKIQTKGPITGRVWIITCMTDPIQAMKIVHEICEAAELPIFGMGARLAHITEPHPNSPQ
jgi:hypothetical protein